MNRSKYNDKGFTGLVNLGNTCFLNSCLQALNHTYELNDIMDSLFDTTNNKKKRLIKDSNDAEILIAWNELRNVMWSQNGTISPNKFVYNVQKIAKQKNKDIFTGWSQNDMPEFLLFIIECIHNSISRPVNIHISGNSENSTDELAITCYKMLKDSYLKEYWEIMDLFYGILVSEIVSLDGLHKHSIKPENYFVLDLPIPNINNKKINIYDCFDSYVQPEVLIGENSWYNEKTKLKEDIQKRITFWSFPKILIITLKRFSPDGTSKKNELIDFPLDNLDLSRYINGYNASQYKYELYAICNHIGNVYMGHYTAFIKNYNDEWIHYNDQSVELIKNPEQIITPMSYCFFYRKKNK